MPGTGEVPRLNVTTAQFQPFPEYGGSHAILYRSEDGRRLVGSFKESGTHTMVMPYDEVIYVVGGSCSVSVEGGDSFDLGPGDVCYLREGQNVTFTMADDFHDIAVLVSDTPFEI